MIRPFCCEDAVSYEDAQIQMQNLRGTLDCLGERGLVGG